MRTTVRETNSIATATNFQVKWSERVRVASQQLGNTVSESSTDGDHGHGGGGSGGKQATKDGSDGSDGAAAAGGSGAATSTSTSQHSSHSSYAKYGSRPTSKMKGFVTYQAQSNGSADQALGDRWAAARMGGRAGSLDLGNTVRPKANYTKSWAGDGPAAAGSRSKVVAEEAYARRTLSRGAGLSSKSHKALPKAIDADDTLSSIRGKRNAVRAKLEVISGGDREFESELLEKLYHEEKVDKVVAYVTSLDAVRKPFDDCNAVLKLMELLRLKVQVKNVYLEPRFRQELEERLPGGRVPHLFVKSYCVGGLDAVEQLNDSGELSKLTRGCKQRAAGAGKCTSCGGFGYVLCTWCQGSTKSRSHNFADDPLKNTLKCTVCNQNGLVQCTKCP